jgi:hypothetical protein
MATMATAFPTFCPFPGDTALEVRQKGQGDAKTPFSKDKEARAAFRRSTLLQQQRQTAARKRSRITSLSIGGLSIRFQTRAKLLRILWLRWI